MAPSSTRQFITVASMPRASPTGRSIPRLDNATPRKMLPPPTTPPSSTPRPPRRAPPARHKIGADPLDGRLLDTKALSAGKRLAGQLDDDAPIERITHAMRSYVAGYL